ncbi:NRAMP family divalent metal transporter [Acidomonas methanolica]|uniref:NRAMP family divalent metal transporter n=1 Tax=Acidomonas methanolica TaxID=437 RepID=UPI00211A7C67|nr:divalent metal cation transporter [Acidomonas methanolica]MCQ9155310.1 divalent metal cation transporter [Acidomonas methanolica]
MSLQADPEEPSPVVGPSRPRLLRVLGPGLITGASDDDPSGIATYAQVGAQFGYGLGWTLLLTFPFMVAIQEISARIGRTTGRGVAGTLADYAPPWVGGGAVALLLVANTINLGADLGAMADAVGLLLPVPRAPVVVVLALLCVLMQLCIAYARYVSVLKWLAAVLLIYAGVLFCVPIDWRALLTGLLWPAGPWDMGRMTAVVAVFGTTISPYMFFWQASEEVEDLHVFPRRADLLDAPAQGRRALRRIGIDTMMGMGFSNLIALAILVTAAATLHVHGVTDIRTSAEAASALRPFAGRFASAAFALGIIGTGLLAVPVLAGSAAYAVGEMRHWPTGLDRRPREARAFYGMIVAATLAGLVMNVLPVSPVRALYLSAVINGVLAVPIMALVVGLAASRKVMGSFAIRGWLLALGWGGTALMALVAGAMLLMG